MTKIINLKGGYKPDKPILSQPYVFQEGMTKISYSNPSVFVKAGDSEILPFEIDDDDFDDFIEGESINIIKKVSL